MRAAVAVGVGVFAFAVAEATRQWAGPAVANALAGVALGYSLGRLVGWRDAA